MAYYVTTPIYYVNGEPHLGHAYTTLACDILARHMRQRGEDVFFLTGTDEHGEPVAQAAEREGTSPRELADRNAERFLELGRRLGATNDFFIRTSDPRHIARVQEVLQRVHEENYFFRLSHFQERLERLFEERPDWVRPRNLYNEALAFIRQGLNDVSLTRARITWGVPVAWD